MKHSTVKQLYRKQQHHSAQFSLIRRYTEGKFISQFSDYLFQCYNVNVFTQLKSDLYIQKSFNKACGTWQLVSIFAIWSKLVNQLVDTWFNLLSIYIKLFRAGRPVTNQLRCFKNHFKQELCFFLLSARVWFSHQLVNISNQQIT